MDRQLYQLHEERKKYEEYFSRDILKSSEASRVLYDFVIYNEKNDLLINPSNNTFCKKSASFTILPSFLSSKQTKIERGLKKKSEIIDRQLWIDYKNFTKNRMLILGKVRNAFNLMTRYRYRDLKTQQSIPIHSQFYS